MTERVFLLLSAPRDSAGTAVASSCVSAFCEDFAWKLCLGWVTPDVFAEVAGGNTLLWLRGHKQQEEIKLDSGT